MEFSNKHGEERTLWRESRNNIVDDQTRVSRTSTVFTWYQQNPIQQGDNNVTLLSELLFDSLLSEFIQTPITLH